MPRRVNLPGADELFRATAANGRSSTPTEPGNASPSSQQTDAEATPTSSGRVKHDEKMTVYVTSDELIALEQARISLRTTLGRKVDRGRFVRAAIAAALQDLTDRGVESDVARRLMEP